MYFDKTITSAWDNINLNYIMIILPRNEMSSFKLTLKNTKKAKYQCHIYYINAKYFAKSVKFLEKSASTATKLVLCSHLKLFFYI